MPTYGLMLGRGGYTLANLENNLDEDHDILLHSIIEAANGACETSTFYLDRCQRSLQGRQPLYVFVNIGVNDVGYSAPWALPNEATWKANLASTLDQIITAWPNLGRVYVTLPWKRQPGGDETLFDTMATWIADVVATRSSFASVGDDERAWFKPNAVTYSDDWVTEPGVYVHPDTAAGSAAAAAAKFAALP
jgi:hypothetical protein